MQSTPEAMNSPQPPVSPRAHQRMLSDAQRQLFAYQREMVSAARAQSPGKGEKPVSPRLAPLGSPGPVTPLELGDEDGYLAAGARNSGQQHGGTPDETLVQVTLQVTKAPTLKLKSAFLDVAVLPSLLNAAFLALVDGGLPLQSTMSAALVAVFGKGISVDPEEMELELCSSVHALAFSQHAEMLLDQSTGEFDVGNWEEGAERAERACLAAMAPAGGDEEMANGEREARPWLRNELEEKAKDAVAWKNDT
ncbi:hypothetical protein D0869_15132 [Hortaea werneckii]|uniref:Uncharacterized protein n=1 Tax=Hortaea werneckii TaxID=91943 RepID=A0A3M6W082_HORWE|nr:hypothetical protein D0869_15132 [Hortaea werneckii]